MRKYILDSKNNQIILSDKSATLTFNIMDSVMRRNNEGALSLNVYCEGNHNEERVHVFVFKADITDWYSSSSWTKDDIKKGRHRRN